MPSKPAKSLFPPSSATSEQKKEVEDITAFLNEQVKAKTNATNLSGKKRWEAYVEPAEKGKD